MKDNTFTNKEIADVFWDYLKRDPEHKDRRQTAWGTKTKLGLALTIKRLSEGWREELPDLDPKGNLAAQDAYYKELHGD